MRKTRMIALGSVCLLLLACSGRRVGLSDDGGDEVPDSHMTPDACVPPPGGCFSKEDCPPGYDCVGCEPDPCCTGGCDAVCYGSCVLVKPPPPSHCNDNADCDPGEYCHLDPGECVLAVAQGGECRERPEGCPLAATCSWICGCDGLSHCSACLAHQAGINVAHIGKCQMSCTEINKAYEAAVQQARTCAPEEPNLPCTLKVWNALPTGCPCPCETYVNPANTMALQQMQVLEQKWVAQKCGPGLPPPPDMACCALYPACMPLSGAVCSTAAGDMCQDVVGP